MPCVDEDTGFLYLLVVVDHLSKFVWADGFPTESCAPVAEFLEPLFELKGAPKILACDNGCSFVGHELKDLCQKWHVTMKHGRPLHPQSQGAVENKNRVIKTKIALELAERRLPSTQWYTVLRKVVESVNRTPSSTTKVVPSHVRNHILILSE